MRRVCLPVTQKTIIVQALHFFAIFVFSVLMSGPVKAAVFYPKSAVLENGLTLVVVENKLSPAIAQMVWYKVGSADEEKGQSGLAHYLEHLMFKGTQEVKPGDFSKIIAAQGGRDNAFTSYDYTAYHEIVASDRLEMVMRLEADRMQNLQLDEKVALPELGVVLNERHQRTDNNPEGLFTEKMQHALFPAPHPYGTPVIGWRKEMEQMTAAKAKAFYEKHYAPQNAIVVISGNVQFENVLDLAKNIFGKVPRRGIAERTELPEILVPSQKNVKLVDAAVEQPQWVKEIAVDSYTNGDNAKAYAMDVLQEVLGGGEVGLLYKELVIKKKSSAGISVSYDGTARGNGVFAFGLTPAPGKTIADAEKDLNKVLAELVKNGIPELVVERAKVRLVRSAIFARDSLLAPCYAFGMALATGGTLDDVENWPDKIKAVQPKAVNSVLAELVKSRYAVRGTLLPDLKASPEARARAAASKQAFGKDVR